MQTEWTHSENATAKAEHRLARIVGDMQKLFDFCVYDTISALRIKIPCLRHSILPLPIILFGSFYSVWILFFGGTFASRVEIRPPHTAHHVPSHVLPLPPSRAHRFRFFSCCESLFFHAFSNYDITACLFFASHLFASFSFLGLWEKGKRTPKRHSHTNSIVCGRVYAFMRPSIPPSPSPLTLYLSLCFLANFALDKQNTVKLMCAKRNCGCCCWLRRFCFGSGHYFFYRHTNTHRKWFVWRKLFVIFF